MDSEQVLPDDPGDVELIRAVTEHCETYLGDCVRVLHEIESPFVHLDLLQFAPAPDINIFVTCGMSSKPMLVPAGVEQPESYRYAEMVLCLPGEWPVEFDDFKKLENWWPLAELKRCARLPHSGETWVWGGHTISHGDPSEPYAPETQLCAGLVWASEWIDDEFRALTFRGHETVFLTLAFVYREEYEFSKAKGSHAFMERVRQSGLGPFDFFVLDKNRPNVCG